MTYTLGIPVIVETRLMPLLVTYTVVMVLLQCLVLFWLLAAVAVLLGLMRLRVGTMAMLVGQVVARMVTLMLAQVVQGTRHLLLQVKVTLVGLMLL
jgi:hypothetical protein